MTKNDWFLDTFAAIVSVSQDTLTCSEPESREEDQKLMLNECGDDFDLLALCRKYCEVNNCEYVGGLYKMILPISEILTVTASRTNSILTALHQYRLKFTVTVRQDDVGKSRWSNWYWNGGWSTSTSADSAKHPHVQFICSLVRFHRPGLAYMLETFFGPDMGYKFLWSSWLTESFVSIADSSSLAREIFSSIAATGEPLTAILLTIAVLDDVVSSTTAKDDLTEAIKSYRFCTENFPRIWMTASEMATNTPRVFSFDFIRMMSGQKVCKSVVTETGVIGLPIDFVVREILGREDKVEDLEDSPQGSSPGVLHSVIADDEIRGMKNLPPLRCIAGASIAQHLPVFQNSLSPSSSPSHNPDDPTVYIDARSEEERNSDNKAVIEVPIAVYQRPVPLSPRNLSPKTSPRTERRKEEKDWFQDDSEGSQTEQPAHVPAGPSERLIVHRFRQFVWMDVDEDQLETDDTSSASYAFMKKLEFFRGNRICVVGGKRGIVAKKLVDALLRREFSYITSVRRTGRKKSNSNFAIIRDELVLFATVDVFERIAIVTEITGDVRSPPLPSPPSPTTPPPETRGIYSVSGSTILASMKKQMTGGSNPFSKFLSAKKKPVPGPTLVLAPSPLELPPQPVRPPPPELDFEIGSDGDDDKVDDEDDDDEDKGSFTSVRL